MTRHPDALLARTWARTLANLPPQLQRPAAVATCATRGTSGPAALQAGAPDRDADPAVIVGWVAAQLPHHRRTDIAVYQRCSILGYGLPWPQVQSALALAQVPAIEAAPTDDEGVIPGPLLPGGGTHAQPLQPEQAPALTLGSEWLDRLRPRAGRLRVLVADDRGVWLGLITDDRMGAQDVPLTHALLARLVPYEPGAVAALEAQARAAAAPSRRRRRKVATTAPGQQAIAPVPAGSPA